MSTIHRFYADDDDEEDDDLVAGLLERGESRIDKNTYEAEEDGDDDNLVSLLLNNQSSAPQDTTDVEQWGEGEEQEQEGLEEGEGVEYYNAEEEAEKYENENEEVLQAEEEEEEEEVYHPQTQSRLPKNAVRQAEPTNRHSSGPSGPLHQIGTGKKVKSKYDKYKRVRIAIIRYAKFLRTSQALNFRGANTLESKFTEEGYEGDDRPFFSTIQTQAFLNALVIVNGSTPRVFVASADSSIKVNHCYTGENMKALQGHTDRVLCISLSSPPPRYLSVLKSSKYVRVFITGGRDENLCVWDFTTLKLLHSIRAHKGPVWSCAVISRLNGDVIAFSASVDGTIRVWDALKGVKLRVHRGHTDRVLSMCVLHEHTSVPIICTAGADKTIRVWDVMAKRHLKMLEGHEDEINIVIAATLPSLQALAPISSDLDASSKHLASSVIISGSRDNVIRVWDLREGYLLYELIGHTKAVYGLSLALSNDPFRSVSGKLVKKGTPILVSCGEDVTVRFWNLESKELLKTAKSWHKGPIKAVCCQSMKCSEAKSSTGFRNVVVSCGWDKSVRMHDMDECLQHANDCCTVT